MLWRFLNSNDLKNLLFKQLLLLHVKHHCIVHDAERLVQASLDLGMKMYLSASS